MASSFFLLSGFARAPKSKILHPKITDKDCKFCTVVKDEHHIYRTDAGKDIYLIQDRCYGTKDMCVKNITSRQVTKEEYGDDLDANTRE